MTCMARTTVSIQKLQHDVIHTLKLTGLVPFTYFFHFANTIVVELLTWSVLYIIVVDYSLNSQKYKHAMPILES